MASKNKPTILIALREHGENGGPYISHKRIMNDEYLNSKFNFEVLFVPRARVLLNPRGFFRFVKTIKESNADLVHVAGLQLEGFFPMLACQCAKKRTVLAVHGSLSEAQNIGNLKKKAYSILERYTLRKATLTYGVSDYVSSWDICKFSKNYFGTIYNISDFSDVTIKSEIRQELGIELDDIVVVSTGRIIKDKGFDILKEVALHYKGNPRVKFVIAGDGLYREEFSKAIKANNQEKQVFLLGYRSDIPNILNGSDIFTMCTRHETLCISLLEAGIHGLPMVATNVGGIPEIVDKGNGILVDNGNVKGFIEAIDYLIADEEARLKMGQNAIRKVQKVFGKSEIIYKIEKAYQTVIDCK